MTRTLFIGLDGATFTVLDELTRERDPEGLVMPFLGGLMAEGARARLRSTPNPLTPPAWVSLMTGKSPGQHGVFDFLRAEEKGDEVYFTLSDARDVRSETIWSLASRQDRSLVALNFPITAPPRPVKGSLVPGFVPWRHLRRNTTPEGLFERLKRLEGFSARELAWDFDLEKRAMDELDDAERESWLEYHLRREEQWFRIARHLLGEDRPDLMAVLFDGVDKIQHQAWRFLDPAGERDLTTAPERRMRELCLEYFRRLDGYLRDLVQAAGPGAQVFLASDHGFTRSTEVVRINSYLHACGYLEWKPVDESPEARRREDAMFAYLDWRRTVAYCRTPSSNGIWIRVAREPGAAGVPPRDYERLRQRLVEDLERLVDERTGERVIRAIHRREDVFPGPAMGEAPDLLLTLRDNGFVSIKNRLPVREDRKHPAGTHHPDGILVAWGPGVAPGQDLGRAAIVDVAAILLHSLALPLPSDLEGRVPQGLYTEDWLAGRPVRFGAPTRPPVAGAGEPKGPSDADRRKILKQLQVLGYME